MLFVYDKASGRFSSSEETDFRSHGLLERQHIEKWVADFPEILGEDLLLITTEYDEFDRTRERLDLLALDRNGELVVVELKRDDSGSSVELQAIKYAAYCSTLAMDDVVQLRQEFVRKKDEPKAEDEIKKEILDFIENDDFEELNDRPRVILVAKRFRPEVTASVLWLRKFGIDISCIKFSPYTIDDERIGLVSSILIPLPEAKDYIIRAERKESIERTLTRTQEEYLRFYRDLTRAIEERIPVSLPEPKPIFAYSIPTGIGGVHFEWAFHGRPRSSFGVELHFEKPHAATNRRMLGRMRDLKDRIESESKEKVVFLEEWGKRWARLYIEKNEGRITDELKTWAVEKMTILYRLLQPELDKLR